MTHRMSTRRLGDIQDTYRLATMMLINGGGRGRVERLGAIPRVMYSGGGANPLAMPIQFMAATANAKSMAESSFYNPRRPPFVRERSIVTITQTKVGEQLATGNDVAFDAAASSNFSPEATQQEQQQQLHDLHITESCWKRVRQLVAAKTKNGKHSTPEISAAPVPYLRVFVDAGGCSGFTYQFEMTDEPINDVEDIIFTPPQPDGEVTTNSDRPDVRVVVDTASLELMRGSKLDYVQEMIKSSFAIVDNPLSESACGCGSSFALKNFASNPALD